MKLSNSLGVQNNEVPHVWELPRSSLSQRLFNNELHRRTVHDALYHEDNDFTTDIVNDVALYRSDERSYQAAAGTSSSSEVSGSMEVITSRIARIWEPICPLRSIPSIRSRESWTCILFELVLWTCGGHSLHPLIIPQIGVCAHLLCQFHKWHTTSETHAEILIVFHRLT